MEIQSNAKWLAEAWTKRSRSFMSELGTATQKATFLIYAESRKNLKEMIYNKPIPSRSEVQGEKMSRQQAKGKIVGFGHSKMGFAKSGARFGAQKGGGMAYKKLGAREAKKPAWRRTGDLRKAERWRMLSPFVGLIYNDMNYATARHYRTNTRYPAPWRHQAIVTMRPVIVKLYREAFMRAFRAGSIPSIF